MGTFFFLVKHAVLTSRGKSNLHNEKVFLMSLDLRPLGSEDLLVMRDFKLSFGKY